MLSLKKLDKERFSDLLLEAPVPKDRLPARMADRQITEFLVDETMNLIHKICDATIPRQGRRPDGKKPNH